MSMPTHFDDLISTVTSSFGSVGGLCLALMLKEKRIAGVDET